MKNKIAFLPLLALAVFAVGCGGGKDGPATVKVNGTCKIGGSPAKEGIQLTFHPIGDDNAQSASGTTDSSGNFKVFTGNTGTEGIMVGKFKVVARDTTGASDESYMDYTDDNATSGGSTVPPDKSTGAIPEKYLTKETTPLEVEITSGQSSLEVDLS